MSYQSDTLQDVCLRASARDEDLSGDAATKFAAEVAAVFSAGTPSATNMPVIRKIAISTAPTGSEQDSGYDLPAKAVVLNVWVDVTTEGAGSTIDVGLLSSETDGDADGFVDGVSSAATGIKIPGVTVTTGSNTKFYAANPTKGVFLADHQAGTDVDQDEGLYREKSYASDSVTAKSVSFTCAGGSFANVRGAIYIMYVELA